MRLAFAIIRTVCLSALTHFINMDTTPPYLLLQPNLRRASVEASVGWGLFLIALLIVYIDSATPTAYVAGFVLIFISSALIAAADIRRYGPANTPNSRLRWHGLVALKIIFGIFTLLQSIIRRRQ